MRSQSAIGPLHVLFITTDSIQDGVGVTQVRGLMQEVARHNCQITLISMEPSAAEPTLKKNLAREGVIWKPLVFGRPGKLAGLGRVLRIWFASALVKHVDVLHSRSDLPLVCAFFRRRARLVWDVRSLWTDQRESTGQLKPGSLASRATRFLEAWGYSHATLILTLTMAVWPELQKRHGSREVQHMQLTTMVQTSAFAPSPLPLSSPLRIALVGGSSTYYDHETMALLVEALQDQVEVEFVWFTSDPTNSRLAALASEIRSLRHSDLRNALPTFHLGLSVCRSDAGVSLKGAAPTKIAEFWASGRPVVINANLGDYSTIPGIREAAVLLSGRDRQDIDEAVSQILQICQESRTVSLCRSLAADYADVGVGAELLATAYHSIV